MEFARPVPRIPTRIANRLGIPAYPVADLRRQQLYIHQQMQKIAKKPPCDVTDPEWVMYQELCGIRNGLSNAISLFLPVEKQTEIPFF